MGFFDRLRMAFTRFMSGRYGVDQLNHSLIITALVMTVIGAISRVGLITLVGDVFLIAALFRMLSKDRYRRQNENRIFMEKTGGLQREMSERVNRFKNRKKFRYFSCPKCRTKLRVPRGVGSVTITCKSCGEKFDRKA